MKANKVKVLQIYGEEEINFEDLFDYLEGAFKVDYLSEKFCFFR